MKSVINCNYQKTTTMDIRRKTNFKNRNVNLPLPAKGKKGTDILAPIIFPPITTNHLINHNENNRITLCSR